MKIQGSNQYIPVNPVDYFRRLNEKFTPDINVFYAEVIGYIEDNLPGTINFRVLGLDNNAESIKYAWPKNQSIYSKPIPGMIVKIEEAQGYFYYTGTYQHTDNENPDFIFNFLNEVEAQVQNKNDTDDYSEAFITGQPQEQGSDIDQKDFKLHDEIISIREKAGDTLIKGYFNNDIILTYDEEGNAIISLVLDRDSSEFDSNTKGLHIYSNFDVDSDLEFNIKIKENIPKESDGGAIVIKNDKIRIAADVGSIFFSSNNKISLVSNNNFTVDTSANAIINAKNIFLGKDAKEKLMLGNTAIS